MLTMQSLRVGVSAHVHTISGAPFRAAAPSASSPVASNVSAALDVYGVARGNARRTQVAFGAQSLWARCC